MQTKRLLIIEDDLNLTLALYRALSHTYKVDTAKSAGSGLNKALTLPLDLIILDLNLPDGSGLKITRKIRELGIRTPILVLSGESGLISKVELLDSGANDYVTKPFSLAELRARIRALLRLAYYPTRSLLKSGELLLDSNRHQVTYAGTEVLLRKKEFLLLECLMRNPAVAVGRSYLLSYAWEGKGTVKNNSLDVHMKSLRDKLERAGAGGMIQTEHGIGYSLRSIKPKVRI